MLHVKRIWEVYFAVIRKSIQKCNKFQWKSIKDSWITVPTSAIKFRSNVAVRSCPRERKSLSDQSPMPPAAAIHVSPSSLR